MLRACVHEVRSLKQQPDLILLTGDLVDLGRPEEYEHLKSILAPLPQRIVVVPGNHDERGAMRDAFASGGYLPDGEFLQFLDRRRVSAATDRTRHDHSRQGWR